MKSKILNIALIGKTNSGKSTLINKIIKEKISIENKKINTTLENIIGVYNNKNIQLIFYDTPGLNLFKVRNSLLDKSIYNYPNQNELIDKIDQAIEQIDGEINKSLNLSSDSNLENLNKKKGDIMDLKMILTGTRSLNYADVFSGSPPSVQRRLGNMSWELYNTTSKPTKTHEMTYKISKEKYEEVLKTFNELRD